MGTVRKVSSQARMITPKLETAKIDSVILHLSTFRKHNIAAKVAEQICWSEFYSSA